VGVRGGSRAARRGLTSPFAQEPRRKFHGHAPACVLDRSASLADAFGISEEQALAQITAIRWHDWRSDPFSRGAYAYVLVGRFEAVAALARPIERTLFFAGEATHEVYSGTVQGATESGLRAAAEILEGHLGGLDPRHFTGWMSTTLASQLGRP